MIKSKFVFVFDLLLKLKYRRIIADYTLEANQIQKMEDLGMKKVILIVAFVVLLVTVAGTAQAVLQSYNVTVNYAGVITASDNVVFFNAVSIDGIWTGGRWFSVSGNNSKAALACFLSAWSMGAPLLIYLESTDIDAWSPCYGVMTAPIQ